MTEMVSTDLLRKTIRELKPAPFVDPLGALAVHREGRDSAEQVTAFDLVTSIVLDAVYATRADMETATIPKGVTTARTLGNLVARDHGAAVWVRAETKVAAGPGALRSADRFVPGGDVDLVHGGWWRLATWVLTPEMAGVRPGVDCTAEFRVLGEILQWRGGGRIEFRGSEIYDVWSSGPPTGYDTLINVSGLKGVEIDIGAATIRSKRNWYSAPGSHRAVIVQCASCDGIKVRLRIHQTTWSYDEYERGLVAIAIVDSCRGVDVTIRQTGGAFGLWSLRSVNWAGVHAEGFHLDIDVEGVFYPAAFSRNGRKIRGSVRSRGAGRTYFLGGVYDADISVWSDNWDEWSDGKIVAYVDGGDAEGFETGRIRVRHTHRPAATVMEPLSALVSIEIQYLNGAPIGAFARVPNIQIDLDGDYLEVPGAVPNALVEAVCGVNEGGAIHPAAHEVNGLSVTGSLRGIARAGVVLVDLWTRGAEAFGPGRVVAGHVIEAVTRGTDGADFQVDWRINCAVLTAPLTIRDVHAPRDVLTLIGYTPGMVRIDNVLFKRGADRDILGRPITFRLPDGAQVPALLAEASGFYPAAFRRADQSTNGAALRLEKARGSPDSLEPVVTGDYCATLIGVVWDGLTWNTTGRLQSRVTRFGGPNDIDAGWELETRLASVRTVTLYASPEGRYGFGGVLDPTCTVDANGPIRTRPALVAALPAAATCAGASAYVSDSTLAYSAANIGTAVSGGGSHRAPVRSNGTTWIIG